MPAQPEFTFSAPVITPLGDGSYRVAPGKVEVGPVWIRYREVLRLTGYKGRSSIYNEMMNHPQAHLLTWRKTPGGGRIEFDRASVLRFIAAVSQDGQ